MKVDELYSMLKELHQKLREEQMRKWHRSVSFEDELFDRWEKAEFLGFGDGTSVYQDSLIIGDVHVGKNTWIGPYTVLDGSGGLTIGDNCSISAGVQIYTHDTVKRRLTNGKANIERKPTKIGNSCYIGPLTIIEKGVTIGDYVIIGAHSFVDKDIPSYSVAFGVPCRVVGKIRFVTEDEFEIKWNRTIIDDRIRSSSEILDLRSQIHELREEIKKLKEAINDARQEDTAYEA